ncbi:uncharacterized protein K02A2.6-like [Conger conger]|uniref:uncharacterized protein K02A2.6-like n=1 Tax=Conger conger TaxID=82655 RepID=UPI002A59E719|nr:uncharacterized protein K02A2.6-like [Conger conger]
MKGLARSYVWWPKMDQDLEEKVKACTQCQTNQHSPAPAPLHPWEWPGRPWSRLHVDFAGPFMGQMFMIMVDAHSKWIEAHIMSNITAPVTIDKLRQVFAIHGIPDSLVTDNGLTFTSELFSEFMQENGIHHARTAPFYPASNGLAERAVQTVKEGLKRMTGDSLSSRLSRFLFKYRLTPQSTTGRTPAEMLLGRRPKSRLDLLRPNIKAKVERKQEKQKERHDQHARERQLEPDDHVYVRNFNNNSVKWLPGVIRKQSGPVSFVVELQDGLVFRRHQDHVRLRYDAGSVTEIAVRCPVVEQPTVETCSPGVRPEGVSQEEVSVSSGTDGPSPTATLTPSMPPAPDRPKTPSPMVPAGSPVVLRRSQRTHKPPAKLNV